MGPMANSAMGAVTRKVSMEGKNARSRLGQCAEKSRSTYFITHTERMMGSAWAL